MKKIFILAFVCISSFCYAQTKVITDTIQSKILNAPRAYTLLIPNDFESSNKLYPVLYLFHGRWGKNDDWVEQGNLQYIVNELINSKEINEMIIVTIDADGNNGNPYGYFDIENWHFEQFFFDEFMPFIETQYRVIKDKKHRAIAGLSMGGGGATAYAQKHNDLFCACYAMSALMSLPEYRDVSTIFNQSAIENDCISFIINADEARKDALRSVKWFVDCGDDDFLLDCNLAFYQTMRNNKIPCELRVREGAHNWQYWQEALYICLPFITKAMRK